MKKDALLDIFIILVAVILFIAPFTSAEIILGQPKVIYNLGDELTLNISLNPNTETNDFFAAKLICNSGEVEIYKNPISLKAGEKRNIILDAKIGRFLIGSLGGECFISASYGTDKRESQHFTISNAVNINLNLLGNALNPGDNLRISGDAKKINGQNLDGFVDITIEEIGVWFTSPVSSGLFNSTLELPGNAPAKEYEIKIRAYDKNNLGEILNEGNATAQIKVNQVVRKIDIAIDKVNINPGNELLYILLVYDQAGEEAKRDAEIRIYNSKDKLVDNKVVKSGEAQAFFIGKNQSPGFWNIEGKFDEIEGKRAFFIERLEEASFVLENQTLIIENTGNVPYKKVVEVSIGNVREIKEVNLEIGEKKKYKLVAPDGDYKIIVDEGNKSVELGDAYLTGKTIGIKDISNPNFGSNLSILIWVFVILILIAIALLAYRRIRKLSFIGKEPNLERSVKAEPFKASFIMPEQKFEKTKSFMDGGRREITAVVALKMKNINEHKAAGSNPFESVNSLIQGLEKSKTRAYEQGHEKIIIFFGEQDEKKQNLDAIRFAEKINDALKEHNSRRALKAKYGICINAGEMIVEKIGEKMRFTSIGSTTIAAKRGSELAQENIILTDKIYRKVVGSVKAEPAFGKEFWKITRVINREKHSEFLKRFMKREK